MAELIKVGELCDISSSKRIFAKEYQESGIPFFRGKEVTEKYNGKLNVTTELFISEEKYFELESKFCVPKHGDMLLTSVGTLGSTYIVKKDDKFYFKDGNLTWFKNFKDLNSHYLQYWLESPEGKGQLRKSEIGSSQSAYTIANLKEMQISLPSLDDQLHAVRYIKSYDNLIENNNRRIAILEDMAQSLYREWFVNFRYPNHEDSLDAAGKPKLIDSPLGQIPEGWEVKKFSEVVNYKTGRLNSNAAVARGEYPFFTCSRETFRTNTWSFDCECVLLAGNNANAIYPIKYFNGKFDAYQRTYVITEKNRDVITPSFLFYCLEIKLNQLKNISTGTSTRFLTKGILDNLDLLIPAPELMSQFNLIVLSLLNSQGNLRKRNENLKQQRDMLLPKLISGQIEL
jgi:type I restriction enzyme S subunit